MSNPTASSHSQNLHFSEPPNNAMDYDRDIKQNLRLLDFVFGGKNNLIHNGLEVTNGGGLTVTWAAGEAYVGASDFPNISSSSGNITNNTSDPNIHLANFIYVNNVGTVVISTTLPSVSYAALAIAFSNAGNIVQIVDCRNKSSIFPKQISTPKIVTASGNLELTPAGNANVILQGSGTGKVAIGTATISGDQKLTIKGTDGVEAVALLNSAGNTVLDLRSSGSGHGAINFYNASLANTIQIHASGNSFFNAGNVGIGVTPTARNNSRLQIVDGIGFPATQVASSDPNTLDDYEEGTWTAELRGATTSATTPVTINAKYTKTGDVVHIQGSFSNVNTTGASGQLQITGMPFPVGTFTVSVTIGSITGLAYTGPVIGLQAISGTTLIGWQWNASGTATTWDITAGTAKYLFFQATYIIS